MQACESEKKNIDRAQIDIRQQLCSALRLAEDEVPFAGELLRVNEAEAPWEAAIGRHLRGFGLSLLVPDAHYARVAEWVDKTHLQGRLVYLHVRASGRRPLSPVRDDSLAAKLDLRTDSPFYVWLENEIARRYGEMICCDTQESFRREARALTRAGQIKSGERHEKDDRFPLGKRSRYVLGWTNVEKIAAIESQRLAKEKEIQGMAEKLSGIQKEKNCVSARVVHLRNLVGYDDFQELDWRSLVFGHAV